MSAKGVAPKVRAQVIERAESSCERCGRWVDVEAGAYSLQHRRARGAGGSRDPITNSAVNLALVCGHATEPRRCHYEIESHPIMAMDEGWRVPQHRSPSQTPIVHHHLGLVYLTDSYGYSESASA